MSQECVQVEPRATQEEADTDEVVSSSRERWEGDNGRRPPVGNLVKQVCFVKIAAGFEMHSRVQQKEGI